MNNILSKRYQEITQYLDNDDLNRGGVRLLDLAYDFDYSQMIILSRFVFFL